MAERVCPWWLGYFLASPIRRWIDVGDPEAFLSSYVRPGMTVLEPGPGMGFFTLPMAKIVGSSGRIIAIDIQPRMLEGLRRRATKAGVLPRIETRLARPDSLGIEDLTGKVDFVLAYAVVHEMPSTEAFFNETSSALKPDGRLLLVEPAGHVDAAKFTEELDAARRNGLRLEEEPKMPRKLAAQFTKIAG
jgi:ubiquinone/menaquinone biosynthesis C-methylase UbiE